jgi:hypothetical protein
VACSASSTAQRRGWQTYRAEITLTRRAGNGVSLSGKLHVSNCIGTATPGSFAQIASGYTNPDNRHGQRALRSGSRAPGEQYRGFQTPECESRCVVIASNWRCRAFSPPLGHVAQHHDGRRQRAERPAAAAPNQVSDDVYGAKERLNNLLEPRRVGVTARARSAT